ncbi:CoA transferase [Castellaniella sp.]|uniref:CoA transferase n=1 Tax=Castellaniella sp. TaxID=1955812 RepID=UPI00356B2E27
MFPHLLNDLHVIELSAFVAAPLGGMTLAQMGADVIRIDPLGGGLDSARWPLADNGGSLFWNGLNKAKKSVAINLHTEAGKALARALILARNETILLTNFPSRGLLDYNALSKNMPSLIQLTITGNHHGKSAVDYTVNPAVGLPLITGPEDSQDVCNHVLPAWDLITGHMAVIGILGAERQRQRTGLGQHVKLALEDAALAMMGHLGFVAEAQLGHERQRYGNYLFGAFGKDFMTADGRRIMVIGLTLKQWRSLCAATELDSDIQALGERLGLDLNDEGNRFKAREDIAALLGPWCARRSLADIQQVFDAHGVCWGPYQSMMECVQQTGPASLAENPIFSAIHQPGIGDYLMPGLPLDFSAARREATAPAPVLGEHTEEVLTKVLGLSTAQIGVLIDEKTIAKP